MIPRNLMPLALCAVALAACSRQAPEASPSGTPEPVPTAMAPPVGTAPPSAPTSVSAAPAASAQPPSGSPAIPAGFHGRYGLVAPDCTTTRGDGKGLLTVRADGLKFYESFARPIRLAERTATHLKARFAYSSEGMEWTRDASLDLRDGGRRLVLEEFGADAVPGPRTYTRCP